MIVCEIDAKTGEIINRKMTTDELAENELRAQKSELLANQQNDRLNAMTSARAKLKALGLTDDEIAAIVRG